MQGILTDLAHEVVNGQVQYRLQVDNDEMSLNDKIGTDIQIEFLGTRKCLVCGRKVKKLYQSGYCFPCVRTLAECDLCIVKPNECHFHLGTCRDEAFGLSHCMIPHYVYLAFSSGYKVGLTRKGRQYRRWVDQGASRAILLAETPTRKIAGEMEAAIAQHVADKTDWRKMLRGSDVPLESLDSLRERVLIALPDEFRVFVLKTELISHSFSYPIESGFEVRPNSLTLEKTPIIQSRLRGMKGQYLILESGVFQVKKHCGYDVKVTLTSPSQ